MDMFPNSVGITEDSHLTQHQGLGKFLEGDPV